MTQTVGRTVFRSRPRYTGANIRTWIGFKTFMLLVEEAVLEWFRERGAGPQRLYHEHGLGLEVVDCSVQLPALLEVDDEVEVEVAEERPGRFAVTMRALRGGGSPTVLRGRVTVALVREADAPGALPAPAGLAPLVVSEVAGDSGDAPLEPGAAGALTWSWRAGYPACHYSDRVQHSAFVAALEDVVDRFLDDRGLSIRRLLVERGWIPVVSRARVRLLAAAHMEETVHTVFAVDEILKRSAYDARMDCWVRRDGSLVRVAMARILHGYAASRGEGAGGLVELDDATVAALTGGPAR